MEKQFDQLLNEKCSWSYRSQKVVRSQQVHTNGDTSPMELQQTLMQIEISQNKYDDVPGNTDSEYSFEGNNQNVWPKGSKMKKVKKVRKSCTPLKKTSKTNRPAINSKPKSPISNSSKGGLWKGNLKSQNTETESSSSEEVLQARNPIYQKTFMNIDDDNSESSEVIVNKETAFDEGNKSDTGIEETTSPIIIKAIPYDSSQSNGENLDQHEEDQHSSNNKEDTFQEIQAEDTGLDIDSVNSMSVEPNTPDLDDGFNWNKTTKNEETGQKHGSKQMATENSLKKTYKVKKICDLNTSLSKFKTDFEYDPIVSDFFNGSLDVSVYESPNKGSDDIFNTKEQEENINNSSIASEDLFTDMDLDSMNVFQQREKQNFFKRNKILKQKNEMQKRNEYQNPSTQYVTIPSNTKHKRSLNHADGVHKKRMVERVGKSNVVHQKISNVEKTQRKKNYNSEKNNLSVECINLSSTEDEKKDNSGNRPRRHARLAASEKIKEIEKFENSAGSDDSDICLLYQEHFSSSLSQNIKKNLDEITKKQLNNISFKEKDKYFSDSSECNTKTIKSDKKEERPNVGNKKVQNRSSKKAFNDQFLRQRSHNAKIKKVGEKRYLPDINPNSKMKLQKNVNKDNKSEVTSKNYDINKQVLLRNNRMMSRQNIETEHKTWENLELDLLNELDNEMASDTGILKGNVSKTIIFKQERLVKKGRDAKDFDLITVSNTSVTKTFGKNTKTDTKQDIGNVFSTETVPAHFINKSVLEKAISAMENCTTNTLVPLTYSFDGSSSLAGQDEELDDIFKINEDLESNPNMDDEKLYLTTNEIMDFTSTTNTKSRYKQNNEIGKYNVTRKSQSKNQMIKPVNKHVPRAISTGKSLQGIDTQALVPFKKSTSNPWDDLMEKLNLENNNNQILSHEIEYLKAGKHDKNLRKQSKYNSVCNTEDIMAEDIIQENTVSHFKGLEIEEKCVSPVNNAADKSNVENENNLESLNVPGNLKYNLRRNENTPNTSSIEKTKYQKLVPKSTTTVKGKGTPLANNKKSPTFKMKAKDDGTMQLAFDSSSTSTKTNYDTPARLRNDDIKQKNTGRKSKDKYDKYLKNLFEKIDFSDEKEYCGQRKESSKNETPKKRNNNLLIAEDNDDIFSVSSSDSGDSREKKSGTGLLCDLFDD